MKTTLQTGPVHPAWHDRFCFYCYTEDDFEMAIPLLDLHLCFLSSWCLCLESLPSLYNSPKPILSLFWAIKALPNPETMRSTPDSSMVLFVFSQFSQPTQGHEWYYLGLPWGKQGSVHSLLESPAFIIGPLGLWVPCMSLFLNTFIIQLKPKVCLMNLRGPNLSSVQAVAMKHHLFHQVVTRLPRKDPPPVF